MFSHILVPLDGSRLAESVLPVANYLAQKTHASVTLIHVIEKNPPDAIHGDRHLTNPEEATNYLHNIALKNFSPEVKVELHVHTSEVNNVPRSITDHAYELEPDLIVMCTHGRGGLHEFLVGSIAQQVIAMGKTPVILIHPHSGEEIMQFKCERILVPLDSQPDHEKSISFARKIALTFQASIHLLVVVPTLGTLKGQRAAAGKLLPGTMAAMLDMSEENANKYLDEHALKLSSEGIKVSTEVLRGDPANTIIETGEKVQADLTLLVTHGRIGQEAFWVGSVAPKVSGMSRIPIFLIPIKDQKKDS